MVRFDKPCRNLKGALEYFREHFVLGDYLAEKGQAQLIWVGKGAEMLGVSGPCEPKHFELLCAGRHPLTGDKLLIRDKGKNRRICYFGQMSPPKDGSIVGLVGRDPRMAEWCKEAAGDALQEIEAVIATRVRRAGADCDRETGIMVAAVVVHEGSRALDPQIHMHVVVINLTYDAVEERWKSVQPSALYRHQAYFREVYYNKLAARMVAAGYQLEEARPIGFNVKGIPAELRKLFSKRRTEILRAAAKANASSQDQLQAIAFKTRAPKTKATAAELHDRWIAESGAHLEAVKATIAKATGTPSPREPITPGQAICSAEAHVFERHSVADQRILLREALIAGRGQVSLDQLRRAMAVREKAGELIRSDEELTTRETLQSEREFSAWVHSQIASCPPLGKPGILRNLGTDQKKAVEDLLGSCSRVVVLQGDAGTGKTTSLKYVVAGIEKAGGQVFGCAPSASATDVLRKELTPAAETLQQFLVNQKMQQAARGKVVLVDEAGLISTREMRDLCRIAASNENRLILVGDIKQHSSVEAGDALRCLQEFTQVPVFRLTEIRRQRNPEYKKAVAMLARKDAYGAFNEFDRLGAVQEMRTPEGLCSAAADEYMRTIQDGKTCLVISPVWEEIHAFHRAVREKLKAAGILSREERTIETVHSLQFTRDMRRRWQCFREGDVLTFHRPYGVFQKHDCAVVLRTEPRTIVVQDAQGQARQIEPRRTSGFDLGTRDELAVAVGDRLLIRANLAEAALRNGDRVEVAGFDEVGGILLKDGRYVPAWFRALSYGYAATSHSSQGKSIEHGVLMMGDEGIAVGNLRQAYVSNSRFFETQTIFTSDKEAAREAMMRPADRKLALELVSATGFAEKSTRRSVKARLRLAAKVEKPSAGYSP